MNGPPIFLKFDFSPLASEQMQNHFGQALPSLLSLLIYIPRQSYKASRVRFASQQIFLIILSSQSWNCGQYLGLVVKGTIPYLHCKPWLQLFLRLQYNSLFCFQKSSDHCGNLTTSKRSLFLISGQHEARVDRKGYRNTDLGGRDSRLSPVTRNMLIKQTVHTPI